MANITRHLDLPGPISAAEDLWYDLRRRASFVEGFGHVVRVEGPWPDVGSRLLWDAPPGGRGRVAEQVDAFSAREGQTVSMEDEKLRGTQTTTFTANRDGSVHVTVRLAWTLKEGNPVVDWLFIRRAMGEELRRTLVRYRIERLADLDDERASGGSAP
jgi:hypothetical protein